MNKCNLNEYLANSNFISELFVAFWPEYLMPKCSGKRSVKSPAYMDKRKRSINISANFVKS